MTIRLSTVQRRLLLVVLCAPLLGLVGVIAAEAVPDGRIADHLVDAQRSGILTQDSRRPRSPLDTLVTAPTECLGFSIGLGDQPERNHVTTAIVSPAYIDSHRFRPCASLDRGLEVFESSGDLPAGTTYLRYWHGHTVLTRPLLGLFGVAGARWIAFALAAVAVSAMAFSIARALGFAVMAILVAPALLTTDALIGGLSATVAIGTASAWAGGWMSFRFVSRRADWITAGLAAALAGTVSAYFDLMTTMPGAYALAVVGAVLGLVAAKGPASLLHGWRVAAAAGIGWIAGLVWMWGSKWIIAAITVGVDEVVDNVKSRVDLYAYGQGRADSSRVHGLTDSLDTWWSKSLTPWIVVAVLAVLALMAVRGRRNARLATSGAVCALIAAVPTLGWYVALSTHSQIHAFLVYRSIPIAFGGVAALLYVGLTADVRRQSDEFRSGPDSSDGDGLIARPRTEETPTMQAGVMTP